MKRALLVTRVSGFIPQFEMNNVKILKEMGYEIHYASNFRTVVYGKDNKRLKGTGIKCHQIDFERSPFSINVVKSYNQIKSLLLKEEFDIIHCHMPMSGVITRIAAQRVYNITGRHVPVIYTAHGFHFYTGAPFSNWVYYPIERYLARYTDKLILINKEDYKRALKFKVRGSVEHTRGIGITLEKFEGYKKKYDKHNGYVLADGSVLNDNKDEIFDIREKYNIPSQDYIITSVGELTKSKNNILIIEAMSKLNNINVTYIICGTGPEEYELKKKVTELGLEGKVIFAGYVNNVPKVLMQADCFVFPSFREGLPVAVMEAMAVGLPIIASKIRGITDLIEHGKGGYLVNGFKPEEYANAIKMMFSGKVGKDGLSMHVCRQQMGAWNREKIKKFTLPIVDAKMRKIYKDAEELYS